jgi:hypothetical protein
VAAAGDRGLGGAHRAGGRRGGVANFGDTLPVDAHALVCSCRPGRADRFGIRVHSVSAWRSRNELARTSFRQNLESSGSP